MKIEHYIPTNTLKPFITAFMVLETEQGTENKVLPDTSIVLAFRFKGSVSYKEHDNNHNLPSSVITGLRKSPRLICYSDKAACLLVIFKEGGAAAIFKEPLHELFGQSLSLDELIPRNQLQRIEEQLNEADNNQQRISIVERFLFSMLNERGTDQLIDHAIKQIKMAKGDIKIRNMVRSLPLSLDPFEKRFRRVVGISPKQFADIIRLRNLIDHYSASESLTNMALTSGYFDQAHFIKDFRSFTGLAPQQFFRSAAWW
jgi:AraC-like DNA-binding protein